MPYYDVYLDKISRLYAREEIKLIMGVEDTTTLKKKNRLKLL
jgi:hypothetical protein